jgi:CHAD domain-containing protein
VSIQSKEMAGELERVQKTMSELSKSLKNVPNDLAPKEVHKLRTATRRIEAITAALPPGKGKNSRRLLKSLEPVRKAAGGVRDMDVLASNARRLARHASGDSLARLVELLKTSRQQKADELRRTLSHGRKAARSRLKRYSKDVLSAMTPTKPGSGDAAGNGHLCESASTASIKYMTELSQFPTLTVDNVHAFRLKVKELRYTLQLFTDTDTEFVEALGDVQHRIGDWHDWQQLEERTREMFDAERNKTLLVRIAEIAKRKLDLALAAANALRRRYLRSAVRNVLGC